MENVCPECGSKRIHMTNDENEFKDFICDNCGCEFWHEYEVSYRYLQTVVDVSGDTVEGNDE